MPVSVQATHNTALWRVAIYYSLQHRGRAGQVAAVVGSPQSAIHLLAAAGRQERWCRWAVAIACVRACVLAEISTLVVSRMVLAHAASHAVGAGKRQGLGVKVRRCGQVY